MGTSSSGGGSPIGRVDHPHAYGDKGGDVTVTKVLPGSSPRVWGQEISTGATFEFTGIIPTRMGTRGLKTLLVKVLWDHPHAYGDKKPVQAELRSYQGSSPRVWGQDGNVYGTISATGIIPTRMGTRLKKSRKIAVLQNQPLRFPLTFHRSFV